MRLSNSEFGTVPFFPTSVYLSNQMILSKFMASVAFQICQSKSLKFVGLDHVPNENETLDFGIIFSKF